MERLQKVIAQAGICSRRKAEALISEGRVQVNGETVREVGRKVDPATDAVTVDGRPLARARLVYYMLHKPRGVVSTAADPQGRTRVVDLVPSEPRVYPVGRLDYDSEGLIFLTNDGELTYRLTHPSHEIEKAYIVDVEGEVTKQAIEMLRRGVELDDGPTAPAKVRLLERGQGRSRLEIVIHEGRNRQIRRMAEAVGFPVRRLQRVRIGPISLGGLACGASRPLASGELELLRRSLV